MVDWSDLINGQNALHAFGYERLSSQMKLRNASRRHHQHCVRMSFTLAKEEKSASSGEQLKNS